jgi:acetoacetate decarboxylase
VQAASRTGATGAASKPVRYGPSADGFGPLAIDGPVWVDNLETIYRTDPTTVAAVLPPPLAPGPDPVVRVSISTASDDRGATTGVARVSVQASWDTMVGEYVLFVGATTEAEALNARERFGEPAHQVDITSTINGQRRIANRVVRLGQTVVQIVGMVEEPEPPERAVRTEFAFRIIRSVSDPSALAADPELVAITRSVEERKAAKVAGIVRLGHSPIDPVRDLVVRHTDRSRLAQQFVTIGAKVVDEVPAADFLPYVHQRYDHVAEARRR